MENFSPFLFFVMRSMSVKRKMWATIWRKGGGREGGMRGEEGVMEIGG